MGHLNKLVDHCQWANKQWMEFIAGEMPEDEYLTQMMSHIILSEQAWIQRISAQVVDRDIWRTLTGKELSGLHRKHTEVYKSILNKDLNRVVDYRRFNGDEGSAAVSDILMHLCTHGAHHRGPDGESCVGEGNGSY